MVFGSSAFLKFMLAALAAHWLTPARHRWIVLLVLSFAFYASFGVPLLLGVLATVAAVAWYGAIAIHGSCDEKVQRRWLVASVGAIVAGLVLVRALVHASPSWAGMPKWARLGSAIGTSYYSLQAIAYVVDAYLGRLTPERSLARVALSLAFFPKIAQGPIERGAKFLPQLRVMTTPDYPVLRGAALLFAWGLFKKSVLADRLQAVVDPVYGSPERFAGLASLLATYAYAFQLYFDFSGYTDMARGCARFFGVELTENFKAPYLATSITEFWRRWHISFSRWLLDYVFSPLQLTWRRFGVLGTALALLATFLLSGLWHGVSWCFLVWGLLHGVYLGTSAILNRGSARPRQAPTGLRRAGRVLLTFHLVLFSWVFFRARSIADALAVLASIARTTRGLDVLTVVGGPRAVLITALACAAYGLIETSRGNRIWQGVERSLPMRWSAYFLLCAAILLLGQSASGFIYLQF